jgi:hypothetical protein
VNISSHRSLNWAFHVHDCYSTSSVQTRLLETNHELVCSQMASYMTLTSSFHVNERFSIDLCRFGEAWAALRAENLLTYDRVGSRIRTPTTGPIVTSTNQLTVSQERGFESNHLVFLKARPQHTMERW